MYHAFSITQPNIKVNHKFFETLDSLCDTLLNRRYTMILQFAQQMIQMIMGPQGLCFVKVEARSRR